MLPEARQLPPSIIPRKPSADTSGVKYLSHQLTSSVIPKPTAPRKSCFDIAPNALLESKWAKM